MTDTLFFDTDCLSAFLWVGNESLLAKLYPGKIVIPKQVYDELSHPSPLIQALKSRVDTMKNNGDAKIEEIPIDSETYNLYTQLTTNPQGGHAIIGSGEAACIALAKEQTGILASNNLRDITQYVEEYGLQHMTTGDILKEALDKGFITEAEGNAIWANMLSKRRRLGFPSFSDYLASK